MGKIFITSEDASLSYNDFSRITASAADYIGSNFAREKYIALNTENRINFICGYFGITTAGKIAVLLNSKLPVAKIREQMQSIDCNVILKNFDFIKNCKSAPFDLSKILSSQLPSTVIFTSGSSGKSKAVLHSSAAFALSAENQISNLGISYDSKYLLNLPLYHVSGLSVVMRCMASGAEIVLSKDNGNPFTDILQYLPTHMSLVATQLKRLCGSLSENSINAEKLKIKAILLGGSAVPISLKKRAKSKKLPVIYGYGSTETASAVCCTNEHSEITSSGFPFSDCKIKISESGEILIKSPSLALGYLKSGNITEKITDESGFFHTGDVGTYSAEVGLTVLGRLDSMFISGGENIYPQEIETALQSLPEIEAAVVLPVEDNEYGKIPAAFIKRNAPISDEKIRACLSEILPKYKIPKILLDIPDSCLDSGGIKPDRDRLRIFLSN